MGSGSIPPQQGLHQEVAVDGYIHGLAHLPGILPFHRVDVRGAGDPGDAAVLGRNPFLLHKLKAVDIDPDIPTDVELQDLEIRIIIFQNFDRFGVELDSVRLAGLEVGHTGGLLLYLAVVELGEVGGLAPVVLPPRRISRLRR